MHCALCVYTYIFSFSCLIDLKEEFQEGVQWISTSFQNRLVKDPVSVFEVTIRILGGLLSAFEMSGEKGMFFLYLIAILGSSSVVFFTFHCLIHSPFTTFPFP